LFYFSNFGPEKKKDTTMNMFENERAIRAIVSACVSSYASGFSDRHISEKDDEDGTINMKI